MKNIIIGGIAIIVIAVAVLVYRSGSTQPTPSATPTVSQPAQPSPTVSATPTATPTPAATSGATTFTNAQVAAHNTQASCYSIIRGSVYDLTA